MSPPGSTAARTLFVLFLLHTMPGKKEGYLKKIESGYLKKFLLPDITVLCLPYEKRIKW